MYSAIVLGLLAIYLGSIQLGAAWSMKLFWIGVIIYGLLKLVEGAPRVRTVMTTRRGPTE